MKEIVSNEFLTENIELRKKLVDCLPKNWYITYESNIGLFINYIPWWNIFGRHFRIATEKGAWIYFKEHRSKIRVSDKRIYDTMLKFGKENNFEYIVKEFK
jgi:hypothetical protein